MNRTAAFSRDGHDVSIALDAIDLAADAEKHGMQRSVNMIEYY
jgi:hypothetical protein